MSMPDWRWAVAIAVAAVATVASGAVALQARTPGEVAARSAAPAASTITVPVERRRLARQAVLECSLTSRMQVAVRPMTGADGSPAVVTALSRANGERVVEGDTVIELAARPVFVMRGELPSFRELRPGAEGADVRQLQSALHRLGFFDAAVDGAYGPSTSDAVIEFYEQQGYTPAYTSTDAPIRLREAQRAVTEAAAALDRAQHATDRREARQELTDTRLALTDLTATEGAVVPLGEVMFMTSSWARVKSPALELGDTLATSQMFLTGGKQALSCPLMEITGFDTGMQASVTTPSGNTLRATIVDLSDNSTATTEGEEGTSTDSILTSAAAEPTALLSTKRTLKATGAQDGYVAVVDLERAESVGLVVPVTALWSRPGGSTVVKVLGQDKTDEVAVSVVMEADGLVQITAAQDGLEAGDQVVVSDADGQGGS